jgi:DNA polymerase-3 subunit epsilon
MIVHENIELADAPTVFFDVETTGLALGAGHRICEIGLLRVEHGVVTARIDTLIDPQRLLDADAAAVNGLRTEDFVGVPAFAVLAPTLLNVFDDAVIVAHNAFFDMAFLGSELRRAGVTAPQRPVIDTLALARRLLRLPSYSLRALSQEFGLVQPSHRAMSDVMALRELYAVLTRLLAEREVMTLGATLRAARGLFPGDSEPETPQWLREAIREQRQIRISYRSRSTPDRTERTIAPLEITRERSGTYLRAYCFLRDDMRTFALERIAVLEP